jgi:hypothetical protein
MKDLGDLLQREAFFAQRLRPLQPVCAAFAGSVVFYELLAWILLGPAGLTLPPLPDAALLSLTAAAAILILLSSRLRSNIVRRSLPSDPALQPQPETVLAAYKRATVASFALLDAAALLGLLVALLSGRLLYGLAFCLAALVGMLTRWPRAAEVDRLLRGRIQL